MSCAPNELRHIPIFSLLDDDELHVLAQQVEVRTFSAGQRIYKAGEPTIDAYVVLTGAVDVALIDDDGQEVLFSQPRHGDFFGFASMLEGTGHQTTATATETTTCLEVDREDLAALFTIKPLAGLDLVTSLAREIHSAQGVIRVRSQRNPNEIIDERETFGQRIADRVASFGGSWTFIISFFIFLTVYVGLNVFLLFDRGHTWDPYPFILLNLFLSMLAAIQAPVIMMSQNRQDMKDRLRSELAFEVNKRSESEIQNLARKLHRIDDKLGDIDDRLRGPHEPHPNEDLQS